MFAFWGTVVACAVLFDWQPLVEAGDSPRATAEDAEDTPQIDLQSPAPLIVPEPLSPAEALDPITSGLRDVDLKLKRASARWLWEHHVLEHGVEHDKKHGELTPTGPRDEYPWGKLDENELDVFLGLLPAAGLCDPRIRDEDLEHLAILPNLWLVVLDTDTTKLSGKGLRHLNPRKKMMMVTFNGDREVPKEWIESLAATNAFDEWCFRAPVSDDAMLALFRSASKIRKVDLLQPGNLTEEGYEAIGNLSELESLWIFFIRTEEHSLGPQVGDNELCHIAQCSKLKWLSVSLGAMSLSHRGARAIAGMPGLTYLSIDCPSAPSPEVLATFEYREGARVHISWPPEKTSIGGESRPPSPDQLTTTESVAEDGVIVNGIGMELKLIPAEKFRMGSPEDEVRRDEDELQHVVRITKPFYLGVHEVTQEQYERIMGINPSYFSGTPNHFSLPPDASQELVGQDTGRFPVERVSWAEATEFCRRLSEREGREYGLPTEAQWEYACRAGTSAPFAFGEKASSEPDSNFSHDYWYGGVEKPMFLGCTTAVGSYPPNAWDLYDMHGNVSEWCRDWYSHDYYADSPEDDPAGPVTGSRRVIRGGAYFAAPRLCRSANRGMFNPQTHDNYVGFRVVLLAQE